MSMMPDASGPNVFAQFMRMLNPLSTIRNPAAPQPPPAYGPPPVGLGNNASAPNLRSRMGGMNPGHDILARAAAARMNRPNNMDPRSNAGIFSRGSNVYMGGSSAAHRGGGPQFGRPPGSSFTPDVIKARMAANRGQ